MRFVVMLATVLGLGLLGLSAPPADAAAPSPAASRPGKASSQAGHATARRGAIGHAAPHRAMVRGPARDQWQRGATPASGRISARRDPWHLAARHDGRASRHDGRTARYEGRAARHDGRALRREGRVTRLAGRHGTYRQVAYHTGRAGYGYGQAQGRHRVAACGGRGRGRGAVRCGGERRWAWAGALPPAAGIQTASCPEGTLATPARGHTTIMRCLPI